jgi:hypothetical protein
MKGYKKHWIFDATDETDDMVWNGSEEYGSVRSECEEDEHTDCERGSSDSD